MPVKLIPHKNKKEYKRISIFKSITTKINKAKMGVNIEEAMKIGLSLLPLINKPKGNAKSKTPKNRKETNDALWWSG